MMMDDKKRREELPPKADSGGTAPLLAPEGEAVLGVEVIVEVLLIEGVAVEVLLSEEVAVEVAVEEAEDEEGEDAEDEELPPSATTLLLPAPDTVAFTGMTAVPLRS